jgi:hypothetical protein
MSCIMHGKPRTTDVGGMLQETKIVNFALLVSRGLEWKPLGGRGERIVYLIGGTILLRGPMPGPIIIRILLLSNYV